MAKRFTDTAKWDREWFQALPPVYKLFWYYLCDRCDHAAIWQKNMRMAEFMIGDEIDESRALELYGDRVRIIDEEKWFVARFISFQYGDLNPENRVHASVLATLEKHGLSKGLSSTFQGASKGLPRGLKGPKDKDKALDKAIEKDKAKAKASLRSRVLA